MGRVVAVVVVFAVVGCGTSNRAEVPGTIRLEGHKEYASQVVFLKDGRLLSAGNDGTVRVWDVENARLSKTLISGTGLIWNLVVSPDETMFATGGKAPIVEWWNLRNGDRLGTLAVSGEVVGLAFSPDGKTLAVSTSIPLAEAMLVDVASGKVQTRLKPSGVSAFTFNQSGSRLTGLGSGLLSQWNVEDGDLIAKADAGLRTPHDLCLSSDDKCIATAQVNALTLWDGLDLTVRKQFVTGGRNWRAVAFSPDSKWLAVGVEVGYAGERSWGEVQILDAKTLEVKTKRDDILRAATDVAFSRDGRLLAIVGFTGELLVWEWQKATNQFGDQPEQR